MNLQSEMVKLYWEKYLVTMYLVILVKLGNLLQI